MRDRKPEKNDPKAAKVSLSLPADIAKFLDEQCEAFGVGRSSYIQLLLDAEKASPRKEFIKKDRR